MIIYCRSSGFYGGWERTGTDGSYGAFGWVSMESVLVTEVLLLGYWEVCPLNLCGADDVHVFLQIFPFRHDDPTYWPTAPIWSSPVFQPNLPTTVPSSCVPGKTHQSKAVTFTVVLSRRFDQDRLRPPRPSAPPSIPPVKIHTSLPNCLFPIFLLCGSYVSLIKFHSTTTSIGSPRCYPPSGL